MCVQTGEGKFTTLLRNCYHYRFTGLQLWSYGVFKIPRYFMISGAESPLSHWIHYLQGNVILVSINKQVNISLLWCLRRFYVQLQGKTLLLIQRKWYVSQPLSHRPILNLPLSSRGILCPSVCHLSISYGSGLDGFSRRVRNLMAIPLAPIDCWESTSPSKLKR